MPEQIAAAAATSSTRNAQPAGKPWIRFARWTASFVGFPLGGLAAALVIGPVNSTVTAVAGGLLTGAILGTAQAAGLALRGRQFLGWMAATAVGLAIGLGIGSTAVGFAFSLPALMVQGAISGLAVGLAQAVLIRRTGWFALIWGPLLAAFWALGWAITTSVGVKVDEQFTVFGAAGAITVTILTAILPAVLGRRTSTTRSSS